MTLTFYATQSDYRALTKVLGTALGTATGELRERVNDVSFSVRLPGTFAAIVGGANYCHVDLFGKYYFVEGFDIENDTVIVNLKEDVRSNFAEQIRGLTCTVDRNENLSNAYLTDAGYKILAYDNCVAKEFPNAINGDSMIFMTVG